MPSAVRFQVPEMPYEREVTVLFPEWAPDIEVDMDVADCHEQFPLYSRRRAHSSGAGSDDDLDQWISA